MTAIISRRCFMQGTGLWLGAALIGRSATACAQAIGPRPLPIPPLLDTRATGNAFALTAQEGRTEFFDGVSSLTRGFNGSFLGPTIRLTRGTRVRAMVTNRLDETTTVHWHGLLVASESDGGPHQPIEPGASWRPELAVDQPAATLWYHAHPHPRTGRQVYAGLAGMLIVADGADADLGLPGDYGVDDIPVILRDGLFDEDRLLTYAQNPMTRMHGLRGQVMLVNGVPGASVSVPRGAVRLRLVNAANARVFNLTLGEGREMIWVGTDGGLLERPIRLTRLLLAPGQRAEVIVDLSDGRTVDLVTGRDPTAGAMMGGMGRMCGRAMMGGMADPLRGTAMLLRITPQQRSQGPFIMPDRMRANPQVQPGDVVRRRRLRLTMGMGMAMMGGRGGMGMMGAFGIDGQPFDIARLDQQVRLGDTEIWEVSGDMMPHPFHLHGVHFDVLSRGGRSPADLDSGPKDTVLVQEPVELQMTFTRPAHEIPFMFHCHTLEHEDGGMMGQYGTFA